MQSRDTKQTSLEQVGAGKLSFRITGAIQPRCSDELPIPFFATYAHLQLGSSLVRRSLYMQWCVTVCQSQHSISDLTFGSLSDSRPVFNPWLASQTTFHPLCYT